MNNTTAYTNGSYGKRSTWQWIAIYFVIGLAVYGIFYYFVFAKNSGNSYGQTGQNNLNVNLSSPVTNIESPNISPSGQANQMENTVILGSDGYLAQTITIKAGSKVTWINKSGADATVSSDQHPTHTIYPPLNLGKFSDGGQLSLVFNTPGTYKYHNHLNSSQTGTIIVQ